MRYCVLGGAGMLGSNLARILLDQGHQVFVIDDLSRGKESFVDERVELLLISDIAEEGLRLYSRGKFDGVFNCAALVGGVKHVQDNGWRNIKNAAIDYAVLEFCLRTGTPLVYSSSCTVYPPWINFRPLKEDDHASAGGPNERGYKPDEGCYGMAKLLGEMAIQEAVRGHQLRAIITRCFNIYGANEIPDAGAHVIPALAGKVLRGPLPVEVWGDGSQKRSFLYVDDAALGMIAALERGVSGEVYNLGTEKSWTVNRLASMILEQCGHPGDAIRNDPSKPTGVAARYADTSKAERELGWKAQISIEDGLGRTIEWCRKWIKNTGA